MLFLELYDSLLIMGGDLLSDPKTVSLTPYINKYKKRGYLKQEETALGAISSLAYWNILYSSIQL
ncbi:MULTISPECIES: hypothetical protein [Flavobacterium]|uniref:hypothetical protein n=1 Tax=Flavobacterium TaxID=237 RepID=UPI0013E2AE8A|nr:MULTISPECIES: hypothetical protein [Flavobacterium]MCH4830302.1 hypothetical protein [Flavobacterium columnare]MCH4832316.1 hypothetical protein [Flavobacterium columnare]QYS92378.1 hypothetical protein JJC04_07890 [Flavobacterium covae]